MLQNDVDTAENKTFAFYESFYIESLVERLRKILRCTPSFRFRFLERIKSQQAAK